MAKILLLDGNSLLYRGFFAMRVLTTADNVPTNAIYSMSLMVLSALDSLKPDAVVCAFDAPVATFRHEAYDDYKGTRQRTPDELAAQRPLARDLMRAFNIPILEIPGFEADDTIGTLAKKGQEEGHSVVIVTGDLDALQLVDDIGPITVMTTVKGVTDTVIYDEMKVRERYGLSPLQIPDYKALKGDSSDNLPGIPGIGDKTAAKILTKYGTIEELVASEATIDDPKLKAQIAQHGRDALRFKDLATIRRNIPIEGFEFSLDYQTRGIDIAAATALFERLEFRTLLKRLGKPTPSAIQEKSKAADEPALDFGKPDSQVRVSPRSLLTAVLPTFDTSIEKADFINSTLKSLSISVGTADAVDSADTVIDFLSGGISSEIKQMLEDEKVHKIVYDNKLTSGALLRQGVTLRGVVFDTLLAAYLVNPGRSAYRLPDLLADYAGAASDDEPHAVSLRDLEPQLRSRLADAGLVDLHDKIELPLSSILTKIEQVGFAVDVEWLKTVSQSLGRRIQDLENQIHALAGGERFSIGSTKQLQTVLFERLNLPAGKKTKTGYSTDSEVLEALAAQGFEIAAKITQWRELTKLKSTYADNLQLLVSKQDGRIHTSLNQTVAATGRLSSSNPNLQNIPVRTEVGREIRKSFVAGKDKVLLAVDYSQIELRIFAHITQDPELVRTFVADEDIHRRTASLIFNVDQSAVTSEQRRRAKTINFAVIYGMSDFRLSNELGIDVATANLWKKRYFAEYPGVNAFAASVIEQARAVGYVQTLLGRRRYTPDINSRVFQFRQAAEREAVNMPVQGTAADIMKLAMIKVDQALKKSKINGAMTLQVHDELVFECVPDDLTELSHLVTECMEQAYDLSVRLKVELRQGLNWAEMAPLPNFLDKAMPVVE